MIITLRLGSSTKPGTPVLLQIYLGWTTGHVGCWRFPSPETNAEKNTNQLLCYRSNADHTISVADIIIVILGTLRKKIPVRSKKVYKNFEGYLPNQGLKIGWLLSHQKQNTGDFP